MPYLADCLAGAAQASWRHCGPPDNLHWQLQSWLCGVSLVQLHNIKVPSVIRAARLTLRWADQSGGAASI